MYKIFLKKTSNFKSSNIYASFVLNLIVNKILKENLLRTCEVFNLDMITIYMTYIRFISEHEYILIISCKIYGLA